MYMQYSYRDLGWNLSNIATLRLCTILPLCIYRDLAIMNYTKLVVHRYIDDIYDMD